MCMCSVYVRSIPRVDPPKTLPMAILCVISSPMSYRDGGRYTMIVYNTGNDGGGGGGGRGKE